jgi:hypothetical protein
MKDFETYFELKNISNAIKFKLWIFFSVGNKLLSFKFLYHQKNI